MPPLLLFMLTSCWSSCWRCYCKFCCGCCTSSTTSGGSGQLRWSCVGTDWRECVWLRNPWPRRAERQRFQLVSHDATGPQSSLKAPANRRMQSKKACMRRRAPHLHCAGRRASLGAVPPPAACQANLSCFGCRGANFTVTGSGGQPANIVTADVEAGRVRAAHVLHLHCATEGDCLEEKLSMPCCMLVAVQKEDCNELLHRHAGK